MLLLLPFSGSCVSLVDLLPFFLSTNVKLVSSKGRTRLDRNLGLWRSIESKSIFGALGCAWWCVGFPVLFVSFGLSRIGTCTANFTSSLPTTAQQKQFPCDVSRKPKRIELWQMDRLKILCNQGGFQGSLPWLVELNWIRVKINSNLVNIIWVYTN